VKLTSNLPSVIQRLQRLQAGLPAAAAAALAPAYWHPRLEMVALRTLRAQWALERDVQTRALYERLTPRILETLRTRQAAAVLTISMGMPEDQARQLGFQAAMDYNLSRRTPSGRARKFAAEEPAAEKNLQAVRDSIRDWVRMEKNRDPQQDVHADGTPLTEDELVARIEEILGVGTRAVPRARTQAMEAAAQSLTGAINAWLGGLEQTPGQTPVGSPPVERGATVRANPDVIHQWLAAVLVAWCEFVRAHLGDRVGMELGKLHNRLNTELL
jgi:hypothetical protein